jgi:integrase/recombinase XerD
MVPRTLAQRLAIYGDVRDPEGLGALVVRYLTWMASTRFSATSVVSRTTVLGCFVRWCEARGVTRPVEVSYPVVERYQRWLQEQRRADGQPLAATTRATRLVAVKSFFSWLVRQHQVPYNPAADLELPRRGRRLPRGVLTCEEVERVLAVPDVTSRLGLRDRAMLEVLYSTGLRRSELVRLRCDDLVREHGTLMVREGKGQKDRVVPIGDRALGWVDRYLADVRPALLAPPDEGALFLGLLGRPLGAHFLSHLTSAYVARAGVPRRGSCHLFRHTMATLMLENGADVRYVQEILGHAALTTTEIYTHVSIRKLKEVHQATHPAQVGILRRPGAEVSAASREQLSEALAAAEEEDESSS